MSKSTVFQNVVSGLLAVSALAVSAALLHRELRPGVEAEVPVVIEGWASLAARVPDFGTMKPAARIVLFSDYACPYCRDLDSKLPDLLARHPGRLAVVRYEYPLRDIHPHAFSAAVAAKCAAAQGIHATFQRSLFASNLAAAEPDYSTIAVEAGVADREAFDTCLHGLPAGREVEADIAVAKKLGIDSVPAFIVDGKLYTGTRDIEALEDIISEVL
jgi:protein-disulfide isomerase